MAYNINTLILLFIFTFVVNIDFIPVLLPYEVNDGQTANLMSTIADIRIMTKIDKNSQIIVEITSYDKILKKEDIYYSKYDKATNSTNYEQIKYFTSSGNIFTCTYDISKDKNDYGILKIKNLGIGKTITVKATVLAKTTFYGLIVVFILLGICLLIGIIVVIRKCCRCGRRMIM